TNFIQRLDKWLRVRIRQYIWKQWKKFKTKVTNLQKLGLPQHDAYVFAST
ncbi:group II intron reverse transcriptase/maturase, partial [Lactobacillus reuteri]|nr:group II intron reverse transcriptase/maturase [Limosilactobacillus reuteri]